MLFSSEMLLPAIPDKQSQNMFGHAGSALIAFAYSSQKRW